MRTAELQMLIEMLALDGSQNAHQISIVCYPYPLAVGDQIYVVLEKACELNNCVDEHLVILERQSPMHDVCVVILDATGVPCFTS